MWLGAVAAKHRNRIVDRVILTVTMGATAVPFAVVVVLAYLLFVIRWNVFSADGYHSLLNGGSFWSDAVSWASSLLPAWLLLGLSGAAGYGRFSRGLIIESLGEDYVQTAVAKGLSERAVLRAHAMRAAYPPIVTIFTLDLAGLLSGTIFIEQIFGLNGIGYLAFNSIGERDLPVLAGTTLFGAALVVVGNLLADVLLARLDPRVQLR
jgi:peptide/nickel transport system permease protein